MHYFLNTDFGNHHIDLVNLKFCDFSYKLSYRYIFKTEYKYSNSCDFT